MSVIALNAIPTMGQLVGTIGSEPMIRDINDEMHNSNFFNNIGDILSKGRQFFIENITQPIRMIGNTIKDIVGRFDVDEQYITISSEKDLRSIPSCMQLPILQFDPVRKLFDSGRIFGFGHSFIPEGDPYGRLIKNGTVDDVLEAVDDDGYITFKYEFNSTDPELSFDELESIEESRLYIEKYLEERDIDFTDPVPNTKIG